MGECGCNEMQPMAWFEGPKTDIYVIELYLGCEYCHTPSSVCLYRLTKQEAREWNIFNYPKITIGTYGTGITVIDRNMLATMLRNHLLPIDESAAYLAEEGILEIFWDVISKSDEKYNANIHDE